MNQLWSWILSIIGIYGLYLVGKHSLRGWIIGTLVQVLWLIYAVVTKQWGFIFSAFAYGSINARNLKKWRDERKLEKELANV